MELEDWSIRIATYAIGDVWCCRIDNVSPGATIARARGPSADEAEAIAFEKARDRLRATRIIGG